MSKLVVLVEIALKAGGAAAFAPLIGANAAATLTEPGCRQFDVCTDPGSADRFVLYEIYDDEAAFQAHMRTPHYLEFAASAKPLIDTISVRRLWLGSAPAGANGRES
jgi:quinol monooxygenase YgiN